MEPSPAVLAGQEAVLHIIGLFAGIVPHRVPILLHDPFSVFLMQQVGPGLQLVGEIHFAFISQHVPERAGPGTGEHLCMLIKFHAPAAGTHGLMDVLHIRALPFHLGQSRPDPIPIRLLLL